MTIFKDIGSSFKKAGDTFVKPVNNVQQGIRNTGNWFKGAADDAFHEIKGDIGAVGNWTGNQIGKVTGIFDNNIIWIVVGIGLVVLLVK